MLLTHEGKVFVIAQNEQLNPTQINMPDNGYTDYEALGQSASFKDRNLNLSFFRYNDIKFVDYNQVKKLYISTTFYDKNRSCYGTRVYAADVPNTVTNASRLSLNASDWKIIYESKPCLPLSEKTSTIEGEMSGGRLAFQAPNNLYLANGDYHLDGIHRQSTYGVAPDSDYSKLIRINTDDYAHEVVVKGLRNPQGITLDDSGKIWVVDHGVRGGDELNLIKPGADYGWPYVSLGTMYNLQPIPGLKQQGRDEGFEQPIYAWLPSVGISSLMTIHDFDPTWDGDLLAGSMSSPDFGRRLFRIRIVGERLEFVENIRIGQRIRYLSPFGKNKIAVWLDTHELVIFTKVARPNYMQQLQERAKQQLGEPLSGQLLDVIAQCSECHSFEKNLHNAGPSLNEVLGRNVASTSYQGYSDALKQYGGRWTEQRLKAFIRDPKNSVAGTTMPETGLQDEKVLNAMIWALNELNTMENTHYRYDQIKDTVTFH